jgi:hypothetical protein
MAAENPHPRKKLKKLMQYSSRSKASNKNGVTLIKSTF